MPADLPVCSFSGIESTESFCCSSRSPSATKRSQRRTTNRQTAMTNRITAVIADNRYLRPYDLFLDPQERVFLPLLLATLQQHHQQNQPMPLESRAMRAHARVMLTSTYLQFCTHDYSEGFPGASDPMHRRVVYERANPCSLVPRPRASATRPESYVTRNDIYAFYTYTLSHLPSGFRRDANLFQLCRMDGPLALKPCGLFGTCRGFSIYR